MYKLSRVSVSVRWLANKQGIVYKVTSTDQDVYSIHTLLYETRKPTLNCMQTVIVI